MYDLESAQEPKVYTFQWEVQGYDCRPYKVISPVFRVNFEVTEWQMELDLSKLKNIQSYIPFRLVRISDVGPRIVTFAIRLKGKWNGYPIGLDGVIKSFRIKDFFDWEIDIPPQPLKPDWLSSKSLVIDVEFKSLKKTDPTFPKRYWYNDTSLKSVEENLKKLYSDGHFHDLEFEVAGKIFKLHKCILSTRWPQIASTLKISGTSPEVNTEKLSKVPHAILDKLFQFAYCGDLEFMYNLGDIEGGLKVFSLVKEHNFSRLNNSITQLSSDCKSTQMFQSYRTSVEMKFSNVTSTEKAMGDFRTCEIPLKPRRLPISKDPLEPEELDKFQKHIRFMDIRLYVDKVEGGLGYNWLMFSIVLGKIPVKEPVTLMCKLYVVGEGNINTLLTEQIFVFAEEDKRFKKHSFSTPFSKGKVSTRYQVTSDPVITWDDLIDESKKFMRKRVVTDRSSEDSAEKKDIYFRFELKLADGEHIHDARHGESVFEYKWDYKIFEDLKLMCDGATFWDIEVTSEDGASEVKVHKAILAARSEILKSKLKEKRKLKSLKLDIKADCLQLFIHYLYTGQIQEISADKIDHLLSVADKYELMCLKEVLENQRNKTNGSYGEVADII